MQYEKLKKRLSGYLSLNSDLYGVSGEKFSPNNPAHQIIDSTVFLSDILSFYINNSLNENFIQTATQWENAFKASKSKGYTPNFLTPSVVELDVSMEFPSTESAEGRYVIDDKYLTIIDAGLQAVSDSGIRFTTLHHANFSNYDDSELEIVRYETPFGVNQPVFKITKKVPAISGETDIMYYDVGDAKPYRKIKLNRKDISFVSSVKEYDDTIWHQVPSLVVDSIFEGLENENTESNLSTPFYLRKKKVDKRFTIDRDEKGFTYLQFGSGVDADLLDYEQFTNFKSVYQSLDDPSVVTFSANDLNISSFLKTKTLGLTPANTQLKIKYHYGGGVKHNVGKGEIQKISQYQYHLPNSSSAINSEILTEKLNTLAVINEETATGGTERDSIKKLRAIAPGFYASHDRAISEKDFFSITKSLPAIFGTIEKCFISKDLYYIESETYNVEETQSLVERFTESIHGTKLLPNERKFVRRNSENPYSANIYILSKNSNSKLTLANNILKKNLKTYLSEYRMLTDGINILDAYIINIRLKFEIMSDVSRNHDSILYSCISKLKEHFDIKNWEIGEPIYLIDIYRLLQNIDGVLNTTRLTIENIYGSDYSPFKFPINVVNNIVYPSMAPSIFEIKYLDRDIIGR